MKFCIVIPTYNRARLLSRTLASVLAQTYSDFEVIVLDNCSPDDTERVACGTGDSRVSYVRNERNLGGIGNWKRGLSIARGEWFMLLSDDDLLAAEYLSVAAGVISTDPSITVYTTAVRCFTDEPDASGRVLRPSWITPGSSSWIGSPVESAGLWLSENPSPPCATLLHTETMKRMTPCGGDWWPYAIDWLMAAHAASCGRFHFENRVLSFYRQGAGTNVSHRLRGDHGRMDSFFVIERIFRTFVENTGAGEDALLLSVKRLRVVFPARRATRQTIILAFVAGGRFRKAARSLLSDDLDLMRGRPFMLCARIFGMWVLDIRISWLRLRADYPPGPPDMK